MSKQFVILLRSIPLCMAFQIILFGISDRAYAAKKNGPVTVDPSEVFTVTDAEGQTVTCATVQDKKVSGHFTPPDSFMPRSSEATKMRKKVSAAKRRGSLAKAKKMKKSLKSLIQDIVAENTLCSNYSPPSQPPATPTIPASLNKLSRAVTAEDVRYLTEKAGFGYGPRESYLTDIGINQGIEALVTAFMQSRDEDSGMMDAVHDLRDAAIGSSTTQTPGGQRAALLRLWSQTNNPYAERFAKFLLSVWTVSGDVIADETFRYLFWDYYERLRKYSYDTTNLPKLGTEITRDPLMLRYLNNELNIKGNPNENYARELMELFTLGPTDLDGNPNYTETQTDGEGDIAVAARMLTGWSTQWNYTPVSAKGTFISSRHENGPHTMFKGTPYAFTGENDQDLVERIFTHHPSARRYYAKEILKEYLTPSPPRNLIEDFGEVIANNNYDLRAAMAVLLQSEAFYSIEFKNTVPKDSPEFAVEVVRTMGLEAAVNYISLQQQVGEAGSEVNNAPSVFWYPQDVWLSPSVLLQKANLIHSVFGDSTALSQPEPDWSPAGVLPAGNISARAVIEHIASALGVSSLSESQKQNLEAYMNRARQYNGTYLSTPYNNTQALAQRTKGLGLYYILSLTPEFQLR